MRLLKTIACVLAISATAFAGDKKPTRRPNEVVKYYDSGGRLLGQSMPQGNVTKFYGPGGKLQGRSETRGRETRFYSPSGKYLGRKTR